jgi:hypothetical protein
MYSHGKKVDTSGIPIVYAGTRELRAKLKQMVDGDTVVVVGAKRYRRAILIPVPSGARYARYCQRDVRAKLRMRLAAALAVFPL